ncbi:MAG: A24 family peptidase, partial [Clostridium sp.]|nr:A24 family peptidase [Clostridium sp.]
FFNIEINTYIVGAIISYLALLFIAKVTRAMGKGDVDIASVCGLFLGSKFIILTMFIAIILGGIAGVFLIFFKGKDRKDKLPFVPFIAIGTVLSIFVGDYLINWYLNFYLL